MPKPEVQPAAAVPSADIGHLVEVLTEIGVSKASLPWVLLKTSFSLHVNLGTSTTRTFQELRIKG